MTEYRNILVALDFSPAAEAVAQRAKEIAGCRNATLTLAHVVEYSPPIDLAYDPMVLPAWDIDEQELLARSEEQLKRLAEKLSMPDAKREVLLGTPKTELAELAVERKIDLIILGSHGRHGIARLLGSTANAVLHHAPCDVLAVRIQSP